MAEPENQKDLTPEEQEHIDSLREGQDKRMNKAMMLEARTEMAKRENNHTTLHQITGAALVIIGLGILGAFVWLSFDIENKSEALYEIDVQNRSAIVQLNDQMNKTYSDLLNQNAQLMQEMKDIKEEQFMVREYLMQLNNNLGEEVPANLSCWMDMVEQDGLHVATMECYVPGTPAQ